MLLIRQLGVTKEIRIEDFRREEVSPKDNQEY